MVAVPSTPRSSGQKSAALPSGEAKPKHVQGIRAVGIRGGYGYDVDGSEIPFTTTVWMYAKPCK